MNFAAVTCRGTHGNLAYLASTTCACLTLLLISGCSDNVKLPDQAQLVAFSNAGPILPELDIDALMRVSSMPRKYLARSGDVLSVRIPPSLLSVTADDDVWLRGSGELLCRIDEDGMITLPIVERLQVAGKRLMEIEFEIVNAYYPKYAVNRPTVIVRVSEYDSSRVVITGAVKNPGVYELPKDRMTLVSAIMVAGGISDTGARAIRIHYPGNARAQSDSTTATESVSGSSAAIQADKLTLTFQQRPKQGIGTLMLKSGEKLLYAEDLDVTNQGERREVADHISRAYPSVSVGYVLSRLSLLADTISPGSGDVRSPEKAWADQVDKEPHIDVARSLLLPVKGANVPFSDVALQDGATIEVQPFDPEVFTVMGLVKRPGVFPYPSSAKYNLLQAISFAGGVEEIADPRYVRVYRQDRSGQIVDAAFELKGSMPVSASMMLLKPGDVIAVEQTPRTHFNTIISSMIGIRFGAGYYPNLGD